MKLRMKDKRSNLDREIDEVLCAMRTLNPASNEYKAMVENLEVLVKMKTGQKDSKSKIPWEQIIVGVFGLIQILAILNHEKLDTITSKALGYVVKGRV